MLQLSNQASSNEAQQGFTLVEVMVALVIFSVGLLGLAGLQMGGMQNNHGAMMRTIATQHTYDMAERIRSSRAGFVVNGGGATACSTAGACSTLITEDFDAWATTVSNTLPSGAGTVTAVGGGAVQITVRWDENRTGTTGTVCPPPLGSDNLQCVRITIIP